MIYFSQRKKLGDLYTQWRIENCVLDCPSSVVGFLVGEGLMDEAKVREFLAVKTSQVIDEKESSIKSEEETDMANANGELDPKGAGTKPEGVANEEPKKEFILKRMAKKAWRGVKTFATKVRESPVTHVVAAGAGAVAAVVGEEVIRRKFSAGAPEEYDEPDEPIEIEDGGEEPIEEPDEEETDEEE